MYPIPYHSAPSAPTPAPVPFKPPIMTRLYALYDGIVTLCLTVVTIAVAAVGFAMAVGLLWPLGIGNVARIQL
jgi:hypothetical protein